MPDDENPFSFTSVISSGISVIFFEHNDRLVEEVLVFRGHEVERTNRTGPGTIQTLSLLDDANSAQ